MPSLRELKKRLKSVQTIEQLSGAMRSAATAKYMKLSSALAAFTPYSEALAKMSGSSASAADGGKRAFVLISGNRGLCGGYHHELFGFFTAEVLKNEPDPVIVACGQKAIEFCRAKKLETVKTFLLPDVPSYEDAKAVTEYIRGGLINELGVDSVSIVYQRFVNMLKSTPVSEPFPADRAPDAEEEGDGMLFVPDRASVEKGLFELALDSDMYKKLLSAASAMQASTVIAMRSAYDNAQDSISGLETRINRLRQAAVTASVLETSAEYKE